MRLTVTAAVSPGWAVDPDAARARCPQGEVRWADEPSLRRRPASTPTATSPAPARTRCARASNRVSFHQERPQSWPRVAVWAGTPVWPQRGRRVSSSSDTTARDPASGRHHPKAKHVRDDAPPEDGGRRQPRSHRRRGRSARPIRTRRARLRLPLGSRVVGHKRHVLLLGLQGSLLCPPPQQKQQRTTSILILTF